MSFTGDKADLEVDLPAPASSADTAPIRGEPPPSTALPELLTPRISQIKEMLQATKSWVVCNTAIVSWNGKYLQQLSVYVERIQSPGFESKLCHLPVKQDSYPEVS